MHPATKTRLGRIDLEVAAFSFGTARVGNIFHEIEEATSEALYHTNAPVLA